MNSLKQKKDSINCSRNNINTLCSVHKIHNMVLFMKWSPCDSSLQSEANFTDFNIPLVDLQQFFAFKSRIYAGVKKSARPEHKTNFL